MRDDKLIRMANQIAANLAVREDAAALCAGHISDYWDPRMRTALLDHLAAGGAGLHPLVVQAAPLIRRPSAA
jgi:formate dehydrogenase subunit delta